MGLFALNVAVVAVTVVAMEVLAWLVHRYIMHGPLGWGWHRSHHEETEGVFEVNDLYAVVFTILSGIIIAVGLAGVWPMQQVGIGLTLYGVLYFIMHDGLVHQRWPFRVVPKRGYLKHLVQAHRLHHGVDGRDGCVSFGFLFAPSLAHLRAQLKANRSVREPRSARAAPGVTAPASSSPAATSPAATSVDAAP